MATAGLPILMTTTKLAAECSERREKKSDAVSSERTGQRNRTGRIRLGLPQRQNLRALLRVHRDGGGFCSNDRLHRLRVAVQGRG